MGKSTYHIRLYLIIPLIFTGISILSFLVAHRFTMGYARTGATPGIGLVLWGGGLALGAFLCGGLITRMILRPVERFVQEAQGLGVPASRGRDAGEASRPVKDEMGRYVTVFRNVSDVLGRVEAKTLFPEIIGQSQAMRQVLSQVKRAAPTDISVLVLGESGTGKELIADNIHSHSLRAGERFVKINCAAIPAGLLESELFGHEKGAFTGAHSRKFGKFETAHKGTVFLDEIGDMPLETQAKILRVLEAREIDRVGGSRPIHVDVRIIAATHRNLEEMVREGAFREDLFFRLNVFPIALPSLRERPEDIPFLVEEFISRIKPNARVSPAAMHMLCAHDWPGNIRELRNTLEGVLLYGQEVIEPEHLPMALSEKLPGLSASSNQAGHTAAQPLDLDQHMAWMERDMIINALKQCGGVQAQAARLLGIKERSLWHRVKKYGIDVGVFKEEEGKD